MKIFFLAFGTALLGGSVLLALRVYQIPWIEQADFDVLGLLWLLLNLPKLMGWVIVGLLGLLGVYTIAAARGRSLPPFSRFNRASEEQRLANDPRFLGNFRK